MTWENFSKSPIHGFAEPWIRLIQRVGGKSESRAVEDFAEGRCPATCRVDGRVEVDGLRASGFRFERTYECEWNEITCARNEG